MNTFGFRARDKNDKGRNTTILGQVDQAAFRLGLRRSAQDGRLRREIATEGGCFVENRPEG